MQSPKKKIHVKRDDTVVILSGKDKGKKGKVLGALPKEGKILVEGINVITKHSKPRALNQQGGIIEREAPIFASKAMIVCPRCNKPTRIAHQKGADGTKSRLCKKCGETYE